MKSVIIIAIAFVLLIPLFTSAFATNENLYVSKDIAEQSIVEKYISQKDKNRSFIDGCSSFAPQSYDRTSFYRYVDQFNPTFDVGFFKNEYPITINSSPLTKSDFLDQSKTIQLQTSNPVTVKILLFENRGPQNIQNVTMYFDYQNSLSIDGLPYISLNKDPPEPVSDPILLYIKGQIEEDFGQSYRYGSPWASYSVTSHDPENIFNNVTASFSKQNHKLETVFEFSFLKPIPKSNLILKSIDVEGNTLTCHILDVWEVNSEKHENLPAWFKNNIKWNNQGMISETELINAINYLNTESSDEIISQVGRQVEKTQLRLSDIASSRFNGGMPIVFSGNLSTESEFIPNAEILIVGDGPCPANGIISKGLTDKFGRYSIFTETMIWDPFDNMIKIHAEYLGNEIYLPSSSQDEVIVVYPTKDTKSC